MGQRCILVTIAAVVLGCGDDGGSSGDGDGDFEIPDFVASGTIVDFETGEPLASGTVTVDATVRPPPTVNVTGGSFEVAPIPPFSVFHVLASSPPSHRATYNRIEVEEADVTGIRAEVLSEDYLDKLASELDVVATAGTGILVAQLVDEDGNGRAGVPASAFRLNNAPPVAGPFFLDAERQPAPNARATSESGYVVFFELEPGLVALAAVEGSGLTMEMSVAPAEGNAATVAEVRVIDGELEIPTGVSFRDQVVPIFDTRGCSICHSGNGIGRDLGNLTLDASPNLIFKEVAEEISPVRGKIRVDTEDPRASLLLTFPSVEDPPDSHPNVTFASPADPDYLLILGWITDGAPEN